MKARLLLIGVLPFVAGCAEPETSTEELRALEARATELAQLLSGEESTGADAVVVRLKFDESVDLDLYVTDPLLETVYFARHESRTGGAISADVRCDTAGPRVEEIRFADPWPGRYRIGVDFPARCDGSKSRAPAPYAVSVNANGTVYETHGLVNLKHFEVVVLEFELDGSRQDHGET
ncbi:MAG: hypothetical protein R3E82_02335 [Pseudomonadales bacterium]|nr:hypothetical protein [Pseudomonadales bacterium]